MFLPALIHSLIHRIVAPSYILLFVQLSPHFADPYCDIIAVTFYMPKALIYIFRSTLHANSSQILTFGGPVWADRLPFLYKSLRFRLWV